MENSTISFNPSLNSCKKKIISVWLQISNMSKTYSRIVNKVAQHVLPHLGLKYEILVTRTLVICESFENLPEKNIVQENAPFCNILKIQQSGICVESCLLQACVCRLEYKHLIYETGHCVKIYGKYQTHQAFGVWNCSGNNWWSILSILTINKELPDF